MVEERDFSAGYLVDLQQELSPMGIKAGRRLQALARLLVQFDRRLNMIMGVVLNSLLMWDLQCILRLEKWKSANADKVPKWFRVLGEFDALNSLANFRFNIPETVFPVICQGDSFIEAESISHPLIPAVENISNDVKIGGHGEFMLITGSNMAGKSTFLRTIGVNMVLAGAGAPVLAERMAWKPVPILTSMRVRDSLSSRESTFYAELKRLRMIIEVLKSGKEVMIILDEILKGTNSRDKHFGSEMFIRQLVREGAVGLIATHDLELSSLEKEFPGKIRNYSFEVQIDQQEFIFDYKLREGVCKTLNATELMKKMGISIEPGK
jgi:DNA mismatch repair ATPase MutS